MRLTEQMIKIHKNAIFKSYSDKPIDIEIVINMTAWEIRDFYENQICEKCANSNEVKTIPEHNVWCNYLAHYFPENFGCKKWKPRT